MQIEYFDRKNTQGNKTATVTHFGKQLVIETIKNEDTHHYKIKLETEHIYTETTYSDAQAWCVDRLSHWNGENRGIVYCIDKQHDTSTGSIVTLYPVKNETILNSLKTELEYTQKKNNKQDIKTIGELTKMEKEMIEMKRQIELLSINYKTLKQIKESGTKNG